MRLPALVVAVALIAGCGATASSQPQIARTATTDSTDQASSLPPPPVPSKTRSSTETRFVKGARKNLSSDESGLSDVELLRLGRDFCGLGEASTSSDEYGGNPPNAEGIIRGRQAGMIGTIERNAVLYLCPKYMKEWKVGVRGFTDGEQVVGKDIKSGRYRTVEKGLTNCYWERVAKGGQRLANDFVTYAPGHITVTILPTDGGFTSNEHCGLWVPVNQ